MKQLESVVRQMIKPTSRWWVFGLLALVWALLYLPSLGTLELKGEEGRRIMPGVTMMRTGNWLQPMIGGERYHNKPPMINWLVALAFRATGSIDEWSARLPSVLSLLAFIAVLAGTPCRAISNRCRLLTGLIFLTSIGMWEKGRLIEIETSLICFTGMALFWWLAARLDAWNNSWATWLLPGACVAMGLMLKGPPVYIFYYGVVLAVLYSEGKLRELFSPAHLVSAALGFGVFFAWLVQSEAPRAGLLQLYSETVHRFIYFEGALPRWLEIGLKSLGNFLPWLLFVHLWWRPQVLSTFDDRERRIFVAARWGTLATFLLVAWMPGTQGRYSMPAFPVAALLIGMALDRGELLEAERTRWRLPLLGAFVLLPILMVVGWFGVNPSLAGATACLVAVAIGVGAIRYRSLLDNRVSLTWATAALGLVVTLGYTHFFTAVRLKREQLRPTAQRITEIVPRDQTLYYYKPGYSLLTFYLPRPYQYVVDFDQLKPEVEYLLIKEADLEKLEQSPQLAGRRVEDLYKADDRITGQFRLVRLRESGVAAKEGSTKVRR